MLDEKDLWVPFDERIGRDIIDLFRFILLTAFCVTVGIIECFGMKNRPRGGEFDF